jgi:hypothetical protein
MRPSLKKLCPQSPKLNPSARFAARSASPIGRSLKKRRQAFTDDGIHGQSSLKKQRATPIGARNTRVFVEAITTLGSDQSIIFSLCHLCVLTQVRVLRLPHVHCSVVFMFIQTARLFACFAREAAAVASNERRTQIQFKSLLVDSALRGSSNCTLLSENPPNNCEQKFVGRSAANAEPIIFSKMNDDAVPLQKGEDR